MKASFFLCIYFLCLSAIFSFYSRSKTNLRVLRSKNLDCTKLIRKRTNPHLKRFGQEFSLDFWFQETSTVSAYVESNRLFKGFHFPVSVVKVLIVEISFHLTVTKRFFERLCSNISFLRCVDGKNFHFSFWDERTIFHFFTINDRKKIPSMMYSLLSSSLDMGPYRHFF